MQQIYAYRQSECYARGARPNTVSMDYIFVETDDAGRPLSSEMWLATWDMPLPEPVLSYDLTGDKLRLRHREMWLVLSGAE
jgi:hypothetical protein